MQFGSEYVYCPNDIAAETEDVSYYLFYLFNSL